MDSSRHLLEGQCKQTRQHSKEHLRNSESFPLILSHINYGVFTFNCSAGRLSQSYTFFKSKMNTKSETKILYHFPSPQRWKITGSFRMFLFSPGQAPLQGWIRVLLSSELSEAVRMNCLLISFIVPQGGRDALSKSSACVFPDQNSWLIPTTIIIRFKTKSLWILTDFNLIDAPSTFLVSFFW